MLKNYPEKVDRWLENLIDRNKSQIATLNATFDPFVGTLTAKNMVSCTSPQWFRIFSTMLAQNYKIWRLKLPKWTKRLFNTDIIASSGVSGSMEADFFTKSQSWKKGSRDQKSRCRTCAEACHSTFNTNVGGKVNLIFFRDWAIIIRRGEGAEKLEGGGGIT